MYTIYSNNRASFTLKYPYISIQCDIMHSYYLFLFTDLNILPLYNLIQHRYSINFMMYKLVNGLLPEVMNELYTTNDQIHYHFTPRQNEMEKEYYEEEVQPYQKTDNI